MTLNLTESNTLAFSTCGDFRSEFATYLTARNCRTSPPNTWTYTAPSHVALFKSLTAGDCSIRPCWCPITSTSLRHCSHSGFQEFGIPKIVLQKFQVDIKNFSFSLSLSLFCSGITSMSVQISFYSTAVKEDPKFLLPPTFPMTHFASFPQV